LPRGAALRPRNRRARRGRATHDERRRMFARRRADRHAGGGGLRRRHAGGDAREVPARVTLRTLAVIVVLAAATGAPAADDSVRGNLLVVRPGKMLKGIYRGVLPVPRSTGSAMLDVFDVTRPTGNGWLRIHLTGAWRHGKRTGVLRYAGSGAPDDPCRVLVG